MFDYTTRDSMTGVCVFFDLSLPSLDTVVHNSCFICKSVCCVV